MGERGKKKGKRGGDQEGTKAVFSFTHFPKWGKKGKEKFAAIKRKEKAQFPIPPQSTQTNEEGKRGRERDHLLLPHTVAVEREKKKKGDPISHLI